MALVAHYPLQEASGTTVQDVAGGNDGTRNGATLQGGQFLGQGVMDFDGVDDTIPIPDPTNIEGSSQMSISAWIYPRSYNANKSPIIGVVDSWANDALTLFASNYTSNSVAFKINNTNDPSTPAGTCPLNEWSHITATFNSGTGRIYVNGVLEAESTGMVSQIPAYGSQWHLSSVSQDYTDGVLGDIRIYDHELTPQEVEHLHQSAYQTQLTTEFKPYGSTDLLQTDLTSVSATLNGQTARVLIESDTTGNKAIDEISDPVTLDGSGGPYEMSGLSVVPENIRLRFEMETTDLTTAPSIQSVETGSTQSGTELYSKQVTVTEQSGTAVNEYQVRMDIGAGDPIFTHASIDGSDIRVSSTNSDEAPYLDHYIEQYDPANETATIWVNVPSIPAGGTTALYLFYGDGTTPKASDPASVFPIWDDADTYATPADYWTQETSNASEWSLSYGSWYVTQGQNSVDLSTIGSHSRTGYNHAVTTGINYDNVGRIEFDAQTRWESRCRASIEANGTTVWSRGGADGTSTYPNQTADLTSISGTGSFKLKQDSTSNNWDWSFSVDTLRGRNYVSPEPTTTLQTDETPVGGGTASVSASLDRATATSISLAIQYSGEYSQFEVQRADYIGAWTNYRTIQTIAPSDSYTDGIIAEGMNYRYRIQAHTTDGQTVTSEVIEVAGGANLSQPVRNVWSTIAQWRRNISSTGVSFDTGDLEIQQNADGSYPAEGSISTDYRSFR